MGGGGGAARQQQQHVEASGEACEGVG
jgi:hypothetical protein